jgi:hypothetical protein
MTYFAIDNEGFGTYVDADDWEQARDICICKGYELIGEVVLTIEMPGAN